MTVLIHPFYELGKVPIELGGFYIHIVHIYILINIFKKDIEPNVLTCIIKIKLCFYF